MASSHDTVAEALRTTLASIVGGSGGYIYTPDLVRRVVTWPSEAELDSSLSTVYLIRSIKKATSAYDGGRLDRRLEFRVLLCHAYQGVDPMQAGGVERERIAADMEADVVQKIWADVRLGQPSMVIDAMCEPWTTDFDWWTASWVICELRIVVRYQHQQDGR